MQKKATALEGLYIVEDFITETEEQELIRAIDSRIWCGNGVACVEKSFCNFQVIHRNITDIGPLPTFTEFIIKRFKQQKIIDFEDEPNMCIINEYEAGQGIMPHTDAATIFGPIILSLSLLSSCLMKFTHSSNPETQFLIVLPPRSLLIMTKSSRYDYKHSISKDIIEWFDRGENGEKQEIIRSRRVSLTFRTVRNPEVDVVINS
ncbi:14999_t:CDS:2 [Dentiscutata heterogama]|uniref:14999_t:CDS:1 n=1 Tax=Dentiscutata heterogama TaxID=1316150 RepID=A0ACA9L3E6_9GLOM|nr:14999_t:CDS:2 [Dentiscutata heterogama]